MQGPRFQLKHRIRQKSLIMPPFLKWKYSDTTLFLKKNTQISFEILGEKAMALNYSIVSCLLTGVFHLRIKTALECRSSE